MLVPPDAKYVGFSCTWLFFNCVRLGNIISALEPQTFGSIATHATRPDGFNIYIQQTVYSRQKSRNPQVAHSPRRPSFCATSKLNVNDKVSRIPSCSRADLFASSRITHAFRILPIYICLLYAICVAARTVCRVVRCAVIVCVCYTLYSLLINYRKYHQAPYMGVTRWSPFAALRALCLLNVHFIWFLPYSSLFLVGSWVLGLLLASYRVVDAFVFELCAFFLARRSFLRCSVCRAEWFIGKSSIDIAERAQKSSHTHTMTSKLLAANAL